MAIQLMVDSASDYEVQELKEKNLVCVPLTITFGEESFKDGFEITKEDFYNRLLEKKEYPKTSQPSPEEFLTYFKEAKKNNDSVIAILLSSGLSGTVQSAHIAKQMVDYDRIYIIDSQTAVAAIRILMDKAIAMRDAGETEEAIVATIEELKTRVRLQAVIDTLEYLYKGGRVTKAQAGVGSLAKIKPLITLNREGLVDVWAKCIGGVKATNALLKLLDEVALDPEYELQFVFAHNRSNCEKFIDKIRATGRTVEAPKLYDIGSTVGSHTGSGAYGYIYVEKK